MSDLIQIVDGNDQLIGHKERAQVDYQNDIYRSSAIWIENSQGEVLLAQRKWTKDKDPGVWGPAASGTVDEGETYESNAYKELEEEIGLTGIHLVLAEKHYRHTPRKHFIQAFKGVTDVGIDQLILQDDEVEAVRWISKQELVRDFSEHPENYVPGMLDLVQIFIS